MNNFIINPKNGRKISIFSKRGRRLLKKYLYTLKKYGGDLTERDEGIT